MKRILTFIPEHVATLLKRMLISVLLLYITRLIFYAFNFNAFPHLEIFDFFVGLWFDLITVCLFYTPYYILFLLPLPIRGYKIHRAFFKLFFHIINSILIAPNLLDIGYFKYTSKRSTSDLFTVLGAGNDFSQLVSSFLKDSWVILIIFVILIAFSEFLYRKTQRSFPTFSTIKKGFYKVNFVSMVVVIALLVLTGRGGFGLRPTGIIEASKYSKGENTAFVLPTAFTMLKTISQSSLVQVEYFSEKEVSKYFNPIKTSNPQNILPDNTNVMVIMLESFGKEFIGAYNNGKGYTPFLDSLIEVSLSFNNAFSNGKKSIEAVPAILASIPTLMDSPYIASPYGDNTINSLPSILGKFGYESAFYHGATNGSMRFDAFAILCGFDHYFGRFEYNNDDHFDKTWGILDEYFNPWTAKKATELHEPFFGTLFTLSSHHPYFIPKHMQNKVKKGPQPICASINYGDYALRKFFEEAKKQPWYENTLFVILADHNPATKTALYKTRRQMYRIPILFYHPSGKLKAQKSDEVFQQLDILPTIIDLLNLETKYYSFGNSFYDKSEKEAITYVEGSYYYFKNNFMTTFTNEKARNLCDFTVMSTDVSDSLAGHQKEVKANERRIKALIQQYNRDLIMNQTTVNEKENSLHRKPKVGSRE
jgi:phosphoglycerol transferase MdoB-like AlkP superfamily enzyme